MAQQPHARPTPIGALEEQLTALQHTKADMRDLRTHMAGLEDELEQLSNANNALQRELDRKSELLERHGRRAEAQQDKIFDLEGEAGAAQQLRTHLAEAREEATTSREQCAQVEQRLGVVGRSHELLLTTLSGTAERLLRPHGALDEGRPLAWQEQLRSELLAVAAAPLVLQSSEAVADAQATAAAGGMAVARARATTAAGEGGAVAPLGGVGGMSTPASNRSSSRVGTPRVDAALAVIADVPPASAWWLSTASELRVERGQLASQLEQRRREHRVEKALLTEELAAAEKQWPTAALALRRTLQPLLTEVERLPAAARREASKAKADGARQTERALATRLSEHAAASESTLTQLEQVRSSAAATEAILADERARAEHAESLAADATRTAAEFERSLSLARIELSELGEASRLRLIETFLSKLEGRRAQRSVRQVLGAWHMAARQHAVARAAVGGTRKRWQRGGMREALLAWRRRSSLLTAYRLIALKLRHHATGRALRSWRGVLAARAHNRQRLGALARRTQLGVSSTSLLSAMAAWSRAAMRHKADEARRVARSEISNLEEAARTLRREVEAARAAAQAIEARHEAEAAEQTLAAAAAAEATAELRYHQQTLQSEMRSATERAQRQVRRARATVDGSSAGAPADADADGLPEPYAPGALLGAGGARGRRARGGGGAAKPGAEEEEPNWLRDAESELRTSMSPTMGISPALAAAAPAARAARAAISARAAGMADAAGSSSLTVDVAAEAASPMSSLCLSDGGTRRAISALDHARACASELLGSTTSAARGVATGVDAAESARAAAEAKCVQLETSLGEERARADGLVTLHARLVASHDDYVGELKISMESMRAELNNAEIERDQTGGEREDVGAAAEERVQGLRLAQEAANREAARSRKEASELRKELESLRVAMVATEQQRLADTLVMDTATAASVESGDARPAARRARKMQMQSPRQQPARAWPPSDGAPPDDVDDDEGGGGGDVGGSKSADMDVMLERLASSPHGSPLLRVLSASARAVRAAGSPGRGGALHSLSADAADGDPTEAVTPRGGLDASMGQWHEAERLRSQVFDLSSQVRSPALASLRQCPPLTFLCPTWQVISLQKQLDAARRDASSAQELLAGDRDRAASATQRMHETTMMVQHAAEEAMGAARAESDERVNALSVTVKALTLEVEETRRSSLEIRREGFEAKHLEAEAKAAAAAAAAAAEAAREAAAVEVARAREAADAEVSRVHDQLAVAREVAENDAEEARKDAAAAKQHAATCIEEAKAAARRAEMDAEAAIEDAKADSSRAQAAAHAEASSARDDAATARAEAEEEIERMRRVLGASVENARDEAAKELTALREALAAAQSATEDQVAAATSESLAEAEAARAEASELRDALAAAEDRVDLLLEAAQATAHDELERASNEIERAKAYVSAAAESCENATVSAAERVELAVAMGDEAARAAVEAAQRTATDAQRSASEVVERAQQLVERTRAEAKAAIVEATDDANASATAQVNALREEMETARSASERAIALVREDAARDGARAHEALQRAREASEGASADARREAAEALQQLRAHWEGKYARAEQSFDEALKEANARLDAERAGRTDGEQALGARLATAEADAARLIGQMESTRDDLQAELTAARQHAATEASRAERADDDAQRARENVARAREETQEALSALSASHVATLREMQSSHAAAVSAVREASTVEVTSLTERLEAASAARDEANMHLTAAESAHHEALSALRQAVREARRAAAEEAQEEALEEAARMRGLLADAHKERDAAEARARAADARLATDVGQLKVVTLEAMRQAQANADDTTRDLREELAGARAEAAAEHDRSQAYEARTELGEQTHAELRDTNSALTKRAEEAEARLAGEAERAAVASERAALEAERSAASGALAAAQTERAAALQAQVDGMEHELRRARAQHEHAPQPLPPPPLMASLRDADVFTPERRPAGQRQQPMTVFASPPLCAAPLGAAATLAGGAGAAALDDSTHESVQTAIAAHAHAQTVAERAAEAANAHEAAVLEAQLQQQLAVARAERAERHAAALELRGVRALSEVEAFALEEEQKARLADERRVTIERQLTALEERCSKELRTAHARHQEVQSALEGRVRTADEKARMAEARVPILEAAAKQAQARAVSEAAARELLQARAEAAEARLGRLEAATHLMRQRADSKAPSRAPLTQMEG